MSPINTTQPIATTSSSSAGADNNDAISRKGRLKLGESMKRKQVSTKKKETTSATAKTRKRSRIRKTNNLGKCSNNESEPDSSDAESIIDPDVEELFEVTYVEDFIDAVDLADDLQRQNSRLFEVHWEQMGYLNQIENEMSKLLGNDDEVLEPGRLSGEKKEALMNLEDMLVQVSRASDKGLRTCDEMESVIQNKMSTLQLDFQNLSAEAAKWDSEPPSSSQRTGKMKKPSLNPIHRIRGTPSKQDPSSSKLALSVGSASPAPSFASSSSFDNKSGKDSQTPVDPSVVEDSRYRACKFKNPPMYVFSSRIGASNADTPKKTDQNSQKKTDDNGTESRKTKGKNKTPKKQRARSNSSQGEGQNKRKGQEDDNVEDSEDESSSESGDSSPQPTYCLCEKVSYGKMVQCDNELCPIEWFHFKCVSLKKIPKGKWFCPRCRGETPTVMKPKSVFLKELEQYNKEKEMEST